MEARLTLAQTVTLLLCERGTEGLADCQVVLAYAMDHMDPERTELRVLLRNCDAQLLAPYVQATEMPVPDLSVASRCAVVYLTDECMVDEGVARLVADGLAEGVERWLSSAGKSDGGGGGAGESKGAQVSWVRNSNVVGLFVDGEERVHVSMLWNGEGEHARKPSQMDCLPDCHSDRRAGARIWIRRAAATDRWRDTCDG